MAPEYHVIDPHLLPGHVFYVKEPPVQFENLLGIFTPMGCDRTPTMERPPVPRKVPHILFPSGVDNLMPGGHYQPRAGRWEGNMVHPGYMAYSELAFYAAALEESLIARTRELQNRTRDLHLYLSRR